MSEHYTPQEVKRAKLLVLLMCTVILVAVVALAAKVVGGYASPLMVMPAMTILMMVGMQSMREPDYTPTTLCTWAMDVISSCMVLSVTAVSSLMLALLGVSLALTDTSARGLLFTTLALGGGFAVAVMAARSFRELRKLLSMNTPTEKFTHHYDGDA